MKYTYIFKEPYNGLCQTVLVDGKNSYHPEQTADYYRANGYTVIAEPDFIVVREQYLDGLCGQWQEISRDEYNEQLNVLPPLKWTNGGFFMSEFYTGNVTAFYQQWQGRYYCSNQRVTTDRATILASLESYIEEATK